jgi:PAS domain S-box-containing protein
MTARIVADSDGRVLSWDQGAEEMLGFTQIEMVGNGSSGRLLSETVVAPRYRRLHNRGLSEFQRTGAAPALGKRMAVTALCKDGTEIPVYLTISRLPGEPPQFLGIIEGRTDLSWAEVVDRRDPANVQPAAPPGYAAPAVGPANAWERTTTTAIEDLQHRIDAAEARHLRDEEERRASIEMLGLNSLAPREKALVADMVRWYVRLREKTGLSSKTGVDLLDELLLSRVDRQRLNRSTILLLTLVTPFIVAVFSALLTLVFSHVAPSIPTR